MFLLVGSLPLLELMSRMRILPRGFLPIMLDNGYRNLSYQGILLVIGVMLLVVSAFPSRWRAARPAFDPSNGPYGPSYPPAQHGSSPAQHAPSHPPGPYGSSGSPDRPGGEGPYARDPYSSDVPRPDATRPMHRE